MRTGRTQALVLLTLGVVLICVYFAQGLSPFVLALGFVTLVRPIVFVINVARNSTRDGPQL